MPPDPSAEVMSDSGSSMGGLRNRRIDRLFDIYAESHRNPVNLLIHWLAVPVIYWSVLALLSALPFPAGWCLVPGLDWGLVGALCLVLYLLALSVPLAVGMGGLSLGCLASSAAFARWGEVPLWQLALFVFAFAWILQFVGHKIEGRKPSFLRDVQFLLIGPAWLLAELFRLFGLRY